jgi:hypothetical protein
MLLLWTILKSKLIQHEYNFYKSKTGTAMGSPVSGNLEQLMEHSAECKAIIYYARYDDILIVHSESKITPETIANNFYVVRQKDLEFTITA